MDRISKENYYLDIAQTVLERNKAERHLRGGQATREKYARARAAWDKRRKNGEL